MTRWSSMASTQTVAFPKELIIAMAEKLPSLLRFFIPINMTWLVSWELLRSALSSLDLESCFRFRSRDLLSRTIQVYQMRLKEMEIETTLAVLLRQSC